MTLLTQNPPLKYSYFIPSWLYDLFQFCKSLQSRMWNPHCSLPTPALNCHWCASMFLHLFFIIIPRVCLNVLLNWSFSKESLNVENLANMQCVDDIWIREAVQVFEWGVILCHVQMTAKAAAADLHFRVFYQTLPPAKVDWLTDWLTHLVCTVDCPQVSVCPAASGLVCSAPTET